MTTYHLHVSIDRAIEELKAGNNLFNEPNPNIVLRLLTEKQAEGKEFVTGCDNEDERGMCKGHKKDIKRYALKRRTGKKVYLVDEYSTLEDAKKAEITCLRNAAEYGRQAKFFIVEL